MTHKIPDVNDASPVCNHFISKVSLQSLCEVDLNLLKKYMKS